ncbi:primosomal protein N' [Nocardia sp. CDC159]|uniref:Probable replication restart protein PriA n=1 Tax=Nocardia pulmonis TaxID=2951408 RepID=A0A9X2EEI3_9NOCA|nr:MULTISPECIES: primosomal protein N' [Nocardia]MCM6776773.1 primosomal protein N' [Nocardia pulmonis]MCM6789078.1 primosomal protein N' [Nocardia sp. CDC159]
MLPLLEPAHLDRDFDYLVPPDLDALAQPGVRVRIRFSGRLIDGFILERLETSDHTGKLVRLERVVSGERVLTPEILRLVNAVAARYAGTRADVLRLAIPPRHAKVEAETPGGKKSAASSETSPPQADSPTSAAPRAAVPQAAHEAEPVDETAPAAVRHGYSAETGSVAAASVEMVPVAAPPAEVDHAVDTLPGASFEKRLAPGGVESARAASADAESAVADLSGVEAAPSTSPVAEGHSDSPARTESGQGAEGVDVSRFRGWGKYRHAESFLAALGRGRGPRAAWQAVPGEEWARRLAELAAVTVEGGRSAVLVVPDQRDLDRVLAACVELVGDSVVGLAAGLGPAARYRRWLAALRGSARVVVGTRSAVFAPVRDLGLIAIWDDGDDMYAEPRAPYPHAREVAMLRAHETGAAFLAGGFSRTAEIQAVVETGWAHDLLADRAVVREHMPRISAPGDSDIALERDPVARAVRIPGVAFTAARKALAAGESVLVQVPRRGYVPALACAKCRVPARCRHCNGPLALPDNAPTGRARSAGAQDRTGRGERGADERVSGLREGGHPGGRARFLDARAAGVSLARDASDAVAHSPSCRWCGKTEAAFRCGSCGSRALRAVVIGAARTQEELGRAFPGVPIRGSGGAAVLDSVPEGPQVVVATIGAEPVAPGGYGVGLLLDGWALLGRADLRAAEDALRRWMSAATLVRPTGQVIVMADPAVPTVQALVRWDPVGHAEFELASRTEVRFPPAVRLAAIDGTAESIAELLGEAKLPAEVEVLGPVPLPFGARKPFSSGDSPTEVERMILRAPRPCGSALSRALTAAQAVRSTHRSDAPLRVQIDPIDIG